MSNEKLGAEQGRGDIIEREIGQKGIGCGMFVFAMGFYFKGLPYDKSQLFLECFCWLVGSFCILGHFNRALSGRAAQDPK